MERAWAQVQQQGASHPDVTITTDAQAGTLRVHTEEHGRVIPYRIDLLVDDLPLHAEGMLIPVAWDVQVFPFTVDPREDTQAWRREAAKGVRFQSPHLRFVYGHAGPSELPEVPQAVRDAALPSDRFATIAHATILFPEGTWRLRTLSDDGIRVHLNGDVVIDDWTWHAPTAHAHTFTLSEAQPVHLRVEHFELDGYAVLTLDIEQVQQP